MLETIFGALNDALVGLADMFLSAFSSLMDLDLGSYVARFPILGSGYALFQSLGVGIVILIAAWQLIKFSFGPMTLAKEAPQTILVRAGLAICAIFLGGYIIEMAVNLARYPYQAFLELGSGTMRSWGDRANSIFSSAISVGTDALLGGSTVVLVDLILSLVLLFMLFKGLFRLVMEILERYLLVGVLSFTAPLSFATLASGQTAQIFGRFISMFFGQLLLMSLSVWSYNLALSALAGLNVGLDKVGTIIQIMLVIAACKVGTRIDTYMQQLGIGVGVTGGGLGDEMIGMAMAATHAVKGAVGGGLRSDGGEDGTGHRRESILGGRVDNDGNVRPDSPGPVGGGLLGAGMSAAKYGYEAAKSGGSAADIASAAKRGAKEGFGFSKDDKSMLFGRKVNDAANGFTKSRSEARTAATTSNAGGVWPSADRKNVTLDPKAQENGVKIGRKGTLEGNLASTGRFMAANMDKSAAQGLVSATARSGNPAYSEQALWGTHNDLQHQPDSEVDQQDYDQMGSDMMMATFGSGLNELEEKADRGEALTPEEENLRGVGAAMSGSMEGALENGRLANFQAHDLNGPDGGREVTADLKDQSGQTIGSVTALDAKGYESLSAEQKAGFTPIRSTTGGTYYMRASGVTVSDNGPQTTKYGAVTPISAASPAPQPATQAVGGQPSGGGVAIPSASPVGGVANPSSAVGTRAQSPFVPEGKPFTHRADGIAAAPAWEEGGVSVGIGDSGKDIISGDDALNVGAALNYAIDSPRNDEQRLAMDTLNDPGCDRMAVQQGLFNPEAGGIPEGHDQPVAQMVDMAVGGEVVGAAVGGIQGEAGEPIIPTEDARHFGGALQAAAGTGTEELGYNCSNFSVSDGVVYCDYNTPTGSYRVQMGEAGTIDETIHRAAQFRADGVSYAIAAAPIHAPSIPTVEVSTFSPMPNTPPTPMGGDQTGGADMDIFDPGHDDGRFGGHGKGKKRRR